MGTDWFNVQSIDRIRRILMRDPAWAAYALADLQPAFAPDCQWFVAGDNGDEGLALLYTGLNPTVLLTVGPAAAVAAALEVAALPPSVYLSIGEEHEPIVQRWYDNSGDRRRMTRMALGDVEGAGRGEPAYLPSASCLSRLGPADAERIEALYALGGPFTPDAFSASQLENGVFFGVENEAGELLAVGGTHIVDWEAGVGAIGNMYTNPAQRGRGHATRVLGAIVDTLRSRRLATIILNVDQRNEGARRLYERFGFRIHCPYIEGVAVLRE